jgi:hypothetical protein
MNPSRCAAPLRSALLAALLLPILLSAPALAGELRLEVKDPSGAAMRASGTLQSLQTGASRPFQTDANGKFTLGDLSFGRYRLAVSGQGFVTQPLLVDVQSNDPISRTITMALGVESARIDVVETTPLPGSNLSLQEIPGPVQTATVQDLENSGSQGSFGFLKPASERCQHQRESGESISTRLELQGVHCFAAVGDARRDFRLHGWSTPEPAVW